MKLVHHETHWNTTTIARNFLSNLLGIPNFARQRNPARSQSLHRGHKYTHNFSSQIAILLKLFAIIFLLVIYHLISWIDTLLLIVIYRWYVHWLIDWAVFILLHSLVLIISTYNLHILCKRYRVIVIQILIELRDPLDPVHRHPVCAQNHQSVLTVWRKAKKFQWMHLLHSLIQDLKLLLLIIIRLQAGFSVQEGFDY